MNRYQLENIYQANGLKDYRLRNTNDLLKVHGINFKAVDGYKRLDDLNKLLYEKFIVNIFNAWGLESRATLIPRGIYFVEHKEYAILEGDYRVLAGSVIKAIDKNGIKTMLHTWEDEEYKDFEKFEGSTETYLRFEYQHEGRDEWLHVTGEKEWY